PAAYCRRLQSRVGPNFYVIVEKILEHHENLPADWPVAGTTGYEVLADINALFVNPQNEAEFTRIHAEFTGKTTSMNEELFATKTLVMEQSFIHELDVLCELANEA